LCTLLFAPKADYKSLEVADFVAHHSYQQMVNSLDGRLPTPVFKSIATKAKHDTLVIDKSLLQRMVADGGVAAAPYDPFDPDERAERKRKLKGR
jgi:hypothetical protein